MLVYARCPNCQHIIALGHRGEWMEISCYPCGWVGNTPDIRIGGLGKGMTFQWEKSGNRRE